MARASLGALALAALSASACSDLKPQVAYPDPAVMARTGPPPQEVVAATPSARWDSSLRGLRSDDERVANVAYRIAVANADLCPDRRPLTGLTLQTALQFSPRIRRDAEAAFHLVGDRPGVEALAADSPAAEAGLRSDDAVLAVDGAPLPATGSPTPAPDRRAADDRPVADAMARIDTAAASGPVRLTVERAGVPLDVAVVPVIGCAYDAEVLPGPALNASADGRHVFVSAGLVSYAASDDALALVLGHEFAHDLLRHHDRLDRADPARKVLGAGATAPGAQHTAEQEADYVGLYLTARAGYDISAAPDFWRRFPAGSGEFDWSHPSAAERIAALAATRDEIAAKRRAGLPLVPNAAR